MALTARFFTGRRGVICDGKWSENFTAERTSRLMFNAESITRMKNYMNEDHRSCIRNFCRRRKESLKRISGLYGIRTLDLCDTGAALYQLSWQASRDDLHSHHSSLRSSQICFSCVHNFIIIFSRVYNEPIQRSAPTWLITLIGRVLDRYRRGEGFEFRLRLSFRNCKSCVFNFDDLHSYNSSLCSSFFFIHIFITLSFFSWKLELNLPFAKKTVFHRANTGQPLFEFSN